MKFKVLFSQLDTLPSASILEQAQQNPWTELTNAKALEEPFLDFKTYYTGSSSSSASTSGTGRNLLRALDLLLPMFEPSRLLNLYWDFLIDKTILLNSNNSSQDTFDLTSVEQASRIVTLCLKSYIPDDPFFTHVPGELKNLARKLLQVIEANHQDNHLPFSKKELKLSRLETILFSYGMENPIPFFELLNDSAISVHTRLSSFSLIKTFLILEDAPTYYLINSNLYVTVIKSALLDTHPCLFSSAVSILSILLPLVANKAIVYLDELFQVLIRAVEWEVSYIPIIGSPLPPISEELNVLLADHSANACRSFTENYFSILYGMFPCNLIQQLSLHLKSKRQFASSLTKGFEVVPNPLQTLHLQNLSAAVIDQRKLRYEELISSRKCHHNFLFSDCEKEKTDPLMESASEIIMKCFALEGEAKSMESEKELLSKLKEVLNINTKLYGQKIQEIRTIANPEIVPALTLKIYFVILLNESFFKECIRQYHVFQIRLLRKNSINELVQQSQNDNQALKEDLLREELKKKGETIERLNLELDKTNNRLNLESKGFIIKLNRLQQELVERRLTVKYEKDTLDSREEVRKLEGAVEQEKSLRLQLQTKVDQLQADLFRSQTTSQQQRIGGGANELFFEESNATPVPLERKFEELRLENQSLNWRIQQQRLEHQACLETISSLEQQYNVAVIAGKRKEERMSTHEQHIISMEMNYESLKEAFRALEAKHLALGVKLARSEGGPA